MPAGPTPTYVGKGTAAKVTGAATPTLPGGWQADDIFLLCAESAAGISAPSGWTEVNEQIETSIFRETALSVYWRRATSSESNPTISDPGDHCLAIVHAFRGCETSGSPIDASAGAKEGGFGDTSGVAPAVTTTDENRLIVVIASGYEDSASSNRFTSVSNGNLTSLTERSDDSMVQGNGGILGVFTGIKASAGSTGTTAITYATANTKCMITVALKPPPEAEGPTVWNSVGVLLG